MDADPSTAITTVFEVAYTNPIITSMTTIIAIRIIITTNGNYDGDGNDCGNEDHAPKSAGKKKVAPAVVHDGSAPIPVEQLRPPPAAGGGKVPKRRQPAAGPGNAEYQKAARRRERGVGGGGIRE